MSSAVFGTPAELLERRRRLILDRDAEGFADLFAPEGVIEVPFAGTPEAPMRLAGRQAILEYARYAMASLLRLEELEVRALYQTQDPEVTIAEVRASGTVGTTGRSFSVTAVQILRIRDGLITLFRDYADPRVLAEVVAA
jgi:ketosteroid isomerase-like protein